MIENLIYYLEIDAQTFQLFLLLTERTLNCKCNKISTKNDEFC